MTGVAGETRTGNDPVTAKRALRRQLLAARATLPAVELDGRGAGLRDVAAGLPLLISASGRRVAAYVSVGSEPGTQPLLDGLRRAGVAVLLPVLTDRGALDWAPYQGPGLLRAGRHGLLEPTGPLLGEDAFSSADLVLVPALAVDRAGHRLGRGGGYYDRALGHVPDETPVLAVVYAEEVLDEVPVEPHDRPVGGALTPTGWWTVAAADGSGGRQAERR